MMMDHRMRFVAGIIIDWRLIVNKKVCQILLSYAVVLLLNVSCIALTAPVRAVPVYGQQPCTKPSYAAPFNAISSCDWVNSLCAAMDSIFTWTTDDWNVDSGYDRVHGFFVPEGWQTYGTAGVHSVRLSSGFIDDQARRSHHGLSLPQSIWQEQRNEHHVAIAYSVLNPVMTPQLGVFISQFEYPVQSVDSHDIPLTGAKPIRERFWAVDLELARDASAKILYVYNNNFGLSYPLGGIIWDAHIRMQLSPEEKRYISVALKNPPEGQNLISRWSCQRIDYSIDI